MKIIQISLFFLSLVKLSAAPPNFIFVLGDDINRDNLTCYGGGVKCNTPNLDKLAKDGVLFTQAYTSVALCAPFRQELLSGRTPWRTKTFLNHSKSTNETKSLPHYLKPLGYRVALVGKSHIGPKRAYPFEMLGDTNDNEDFLAKTKKFIDSCSAKGTPFCLIIASHDAHGPYTNGDPTQYNPEALNIPPYWIDTPELRASLPPYLAEVTNFDSLVGDVRNYIDRAKLAKNTVLFACTEQGSGFPFAKWTCFDNGLHSGLIAYAPGKIPRGHVSNPLLWMCDIAPTIVDMAGGKIKPKYFDGKSQLANFTGKQVEIHKYVFGEFSNKGIIDNHNRIYPIRSIRDGRYSLIYSPRTDGRTSNVTLSSALELFNRDPANPEPMKGKKVNPPASWVLKSGPKDPLVRKLFKRPEYALYDLKNDPYELTNMISSPQHQAKLKELKTALMTFLKANNDADPVATEKAIQKGPNN